MHLNEKVGNSAVFGMIVSGMVMWISIESVYTFKLVEMKKFNLSSQDYEIAQSGLSDRIPLSSKSNWSFLSSKYVISKALIAYIIIYTLALIVYNQINQHFEDQK